MIYIPALALFYFQNDLSKQILVNALKTLII